MKKMVLFCALISLFSLAHEQNKSLKIKRLTDNVYQHISHKFVEPWGNVAASGLIVIDGEFAHIIDTPWSIAETEQLITWAESKGLTVKSAIVSHFHEDASIGLSLVNERKIKSYATTLTNELLAKKSAAHANNEITKSSFEVVNNTIEVFYPGAGHSPDNIVVWLPKEKILFGGCFVKSLNSKTLGNLSDASITQWPDSIERVLSKYPNIEMVVPGHGKIGDISLLKHTAQLAINKTDPSGK